MESGAGLSVGSEGTETDMKIERWKSSDYSGNEAYRLFVDGKPVTDLMVARGTATNAGLERMGEIWMRMSKPAIERARRENGMGVVPKRKGSKCTDTKECPGRYDEDLKCFICHPDHQPKPRPASEPPTDVEPVDEKPIGYSELLGPEHDKKLR